jgi:[ribosomal protein S5]-alanine N-acetyltransferase
MIFETERLIVKPFTANNQEEFFKVNGDPEVMKYIRPAKSREQADEFLIEVIAYNNDKKNYGRWAVWQKLSGLFVGSFALIPVEGSDKMQLGYALLPSYWGLGYASELTKAGIEYTFTKTNLNKVYGYTEKDNLPSKKVLEKCGFSFNGEKKEENKIILEYVLEKKSSEFSTENPMDQ